MSTTRALPALALTAALIVSLPLSMPLSRSVAWAAPARSTASAKKKPSRAAKRRTTRARPRARARRKGCRGLFCNGVRVVSMGGGGGAKGGLTFDQVNREMGRLQAKLQPCALQARRRDPRLREARIEFVVSPRGSVLATRVNGQRRSVLARCIHGTLRRLARFPHWRYRQVAEFRLTLSQ